VNALFRELWSDFPEYWVTFWFSGNKESLHLPVEKVLAGGDEDLKELNEYAAGRNTYFGLGLRRDDLGPSRQGGKKDVVVLSALALDIDFYNPSAHKAHNLPRDLDEASQFLVQQDGKTPQKPPSAVVMTGNGAHLYWYLKEPMVFSGFKEGFGRERAEKLYQMFQAPMIARAKELGWHLDKTATLQRVWRVPGTINQKTSKPVELVHV
jgi:hypothetical protein